ncbi:MAG: CDP-alcohol phosphatidyltransferase family protein [Candidatus Binatia bacterium]
MTTPDAQTPPVGCVIGHSPVRLFGLDGAQRLERQLRAVGLRQVRHDGEALPADGAVQLVRGDYLFDDRTLRDLAASPGTILSVTDRRGTTMVAAHVPAEWAAEARALLAGTVPPPVIPDVSVRSAHGLSSAYLGKLLKAAPPVLLPISAGGAAALERHLFEGSYKGVTDLVTKWLWPLPARWATGWCARWGVTPNAVTALSFVLAVLTTLLFMRGAFALGLALGWLMTFLDTVDGKLARVTVTSTPFGHIFDHAIDVVHPPLWYLAWAYGVAGDANGLAPMQAAMVAIVVGYIAGRLIESAFEHGLAGFSLFTWRPIDSWFRLITARRNPNLLLLTGFALAGLPRQGLDAVAVWTVLSSLILAIRLGQAAIARSRRQALRPWLEEVGREHADLPLYTRPFVANPAALQRLVP